MTEDCFNHRLDENPQIDLVLAFFECGLTYRFSTRHWKCLQLYKQLNIFIFDYSHLYLVSIGMGCCFRIIIFLMNQFCLLNIQMYR